MFQIIRLTITLLSTFFIASVVYCQEPFNIVDNYGIRKARGEAILEIDDTRLLAIGSGAKLIAPNLVRWGLYIAELNTSTGETTYFDTLFFSSFVNLGFHNTILRNDDTAFFIVTSGPELFQVNYNLIEHEVSAIDTLHKKNFVTGYGPIQTTVIDGTLFIASSENTEDSSKYAIHVIGNNVSNLTTVEGLGKQLNAGPFEVLENGNFLISGSYEKTRLLIGEINVEGDFVDKFIFPEDVNIFLPNRMIRLNDEELLFSAGEWRESDTWPYVDGWRPVVIRVNYKTNEIVWVHNGDEEFSEYNNGSFSSLIPTTSGNYIYAGTSAEGLEIRGVIGELDIDGNLIWQKYYSIDDCDLCRNEITDLEFLATGELVAYGKFSYLIIPEDGNSVFSWLMKLDENGEILSTSIVNTVDDDLNEQGFDFLIYPNPGVDVLNISTDERRVDFKIVNSIGEQVMFVKGDYTPIESVDVSNLPKGIYIIEVIDKDKILTSKYFVKQ